MTKEELINIYQNTVAKCANIVEPINTKLKCVETKLLTPINRVKIVEELDTVSALIKYCDKKTAILNMASARRKGGGVENGARAQEECLFRCSNLYTISQDLYPLSNDEYIYSNDVSFIKDGSYRDMYPVTCDVITIAAINLSSQLSAEIDPSDYTKITKNKIYNMLHSASENGCKNIILGAWGCGVFKNDPTQMAIMFDEVIDRSGFDFDNIIFAVINDHNSVDNNCQIFKNILSV